MSKLKDLFVKVQEFVAKGGEPVLVVGNGVAVIIYFVAQVSGSIPDQTFEQALANAAAGVATLNTVLLFIRSLVSPAKSLET